ncbi:MAG: hypothetical protein Q7K40_05235 [bacterium]|nr:hypothetical protein [bacterium]
MYEIVKTIIGFTAIIIVGLAGVTVSEILKLGDINSAIMTVDNVARVR